LPGAFLCCAPLPFLLPGPHLLHRNCVVLEDLYGIRHFDDFISAADRNFSRKIAIRYGQHACTQRLKPPHNIAPDIAPGDEERSQETKPGQRPQNDFGLADC
jgi:hypothetical protein